MVRSERLPRLIVAVAVALLIGYAGIWAQVGSTTIARSDFTSTYVGGTLLREGHRSDLYDETLQAHLHSQVIAPDREGSLPFDDAPVGAALAAPVTLLSLGVAYRVWGLIQLLLIVIAIALVARTAPWPRGTSAPWKSATALAGLGAVATLSLLMEAQWTGVNALGLALAYRAWRAGRLTQGAALLVLTAGIAKPHLAICLVAFMVGWRDRRILAGIGLGVGGVTLASLALVGSAGLSGWIGLVTASSSRWDPSTFVSLAGLSGTYAGRSAVTAVLWVVGGLLACALAWSAGAAVRANRARLEGALAAAVVLGLLATPHAYPHDLVLLAPVFVWSLAAALTREPSGIVGAGRDAAVVLWCWTVLALAELLGVTAVAAPAGAIIPGLLMGVATIALATAHRDRRRWEAAAQG